MIYDSNVLCHELLRQKDLLFNRHSLISKYIKYGMNDNRKPNGIIELLILDIKYSKSHNAFV